MKGSDREDMENKTYQYIYGCSLLLFKSFKNKILTTAVKFEEKFEKKTLNDSEE